MWVRQCDLDAQDEASPPIPSADRLQRGIHPAAAEPAAEGVRGPPCSHQRASRPAPGAEPPRLPAHRQRHGRRPARPQRRSSATATTCRAEEVEDQKAFEEKWPKDQFIFDVQTHHVDVSQQVVRRHAAGQGDACASSRCCGPFAGSLEKSLEQLNRAHYVKEVFGDSDTVMAIISGVPSRDWDKNPLPPDQMVATRKYVNDLAGSQRVLSHGLLRPNLGKKEMEEMERQVKELKIDAWKMYTGAELGEKAWFMDDEKVAYPFWEKTKKLGIKNLCVHKGLPLGAFNEKACTPLDLEKAAKDWPDLNFIVYHSGFRGFGALGQGTGDKVKDPKSDDPQEIPWISDILRILEEEPEDQEHLLRAGQHLPA